MCDGFGYDTPSKAEDTLTGVTPQPKFAAGTVSAPAVPTVPEQTGAPVDGSDKQLYCFSSSGTVSVERDQAGRLTKSYLDVVPWVEGTERKAGLTLETAPSGHLVLTSTRTGEQIFLQPGDLAALDNFVHVSREFVDGAKRNLNETQLVAE